ncbi:MAG: hypothetical protein F7B18_06195 [Desulfurococcales archaeon]|nr:hypothetical protein [Desulfurococcales archaeon]
MILRVIGALLLIASIITGLTLAGFTMAGMESTIGSYGSLIYGAFGNTYVTADEENLITVWVVDFTRGGPITDVEAEVYRYKLVYSFTASQGSPYYPGVITQTATVTFINSTGTTVTTTQIQIPIATGTGNMFTGYYINECRIYVLATSDIERALRNPDAFSKLRNPPITGDPLLNKAYMKLVESYASYKFTVQDPGSSCSIEETIRERPSIIIVMHLIDPDRLSINTGTAVIPGSLAHEYILNRSIDPIEIETPSGKSIVYLRDFLDSMAHNIAFTSSISIKAVLEASPMALWRLASIAVLGLILMRLDRGEKGDLLPRSFRRLARRLGTDKS